ncbi:MAG: epoxyqueuosine reductase [Eubacterium sp.]|nr:epoxyqueuosine reductase [Eubacterium sp.]
MERNLNEAISKIALDMGAGRVGFANLEVLPPKERLGYAKAVSVIIPLSRGVLSQIKDAPTITYFSHYRAVNRLLDQITLRILLLIEAQGYEAFSVPASQSLPGRADPYRGVFQHKTAAVLSGQGWIGKSALFVHPDYGPAVRLGTVLTDAPLETEEVAPKSQCGGCDACKRACPAMAIEGVTWTPGMARNMLYDAHSCSAHMKEAYQHIGRGSVCGLCIVSCPYFKKNLKP